MYTIKCCLGMPRNVSNLTSPLSMLQQDEENQQTIDTSNNSGPMLLYRSPLRPQSRFLNRLKMLFYFAILLDICIVSYLYFGGGEKKNSSDFFNKTYVQPLAFAITILIDLLGALGIRSGNLRHITLFLIVIAIMFLWEITSIERYVVQISAVKLI